MHAARIPTAMAALGLMMGAAVAVVPATAAEQVAGPRLAQAQSYSDEKLQSFAMAALDVEMIRQQFTQEIAQVEDAGRRDQLVQQANDQMIDAVETAPGISVDEYNEIVHAAEQDPALAEQIAQYMRPLLE